MKRMATSNAVRLQNLALSIAARDGKGLDLSQQSKENLVCQYIPAHAISPGDSVVVIGCDDINILKNVANAATTKGSILVLEPDNLDTLKSQALELEKDLGFNNWRFEQSTLDDLSTNQSFASQLLQERPIHSLQDHQNFVINIEAQCSEKPLVSDNSADVVLLNLAVNRLSISSVKKLLNQAFRVLRRGGKLIVLLLLTDEPLTAEIPPILNHQDLSFIPLETEVMKLLEEAGYYGMQYLQRSSLPLRVVAGAEIHLFCVEAFKGKQGICLDRGHAVIYRGPWQAVSDDDGHRYVRGERVAVCEKTYEILKRSPYCDEFMTVPCYLEVPVDQAPLFDCNTPSLRDPQISKGQKTVFDQNSCCNPASSSCC
jgi:arsenite methyltransferase